MKITVLGASGSEAPGQNPPGFLVDDFLLLDAGTVSHSLDIAAQCKITHVFLTHAHLDHIKAIPFLINNIVANCHKSSLLILSGRQVISDVRRNIFNNKIWPDFTLIPTPENPSMRYRTISTREILHIGCYKIQATRVNHATVPAYGYTLENSSGDTVVYTGDTGPTERIWQRMRGRRIRCLIVEVSFPDEMTDLALKSGHLTPALLSKELEKMTEVPERILITHLNPYYKESIEKQLADLKVRVEILSDGTCIHI
jgi:ribonuclease BN (tRNA processing enzyme)